MTGSRATDRSKKRAARCCGVFLSGAFALSPVASLAQAEMPKVDTADPTPECGVVAMTKETSESTVVRHSSGSGASTTIVKRGPNGEIVLEQTGPCNDAEIAQGGRDNSAVVRQTGTGNRVVVKQGGSK